MAELSMTRGDDREVTFTFAGSATFVDGDVVRFTVKRRVDDTDDVAVVALVSPDTITLEGATATALIPSAATASFYDHADLVYDWQLRNAAGRVRTLDTGRIHVAPDVTRST